MATAPKKKLISSDNDSKWSMKKKLIGSDNDTEWSPVLAPDLIRSILERLNFVEFHRARSISSDWYSTAELCYRQNPTPWLILFSNYRHISCKLFDPLHDKTYVIRDLGFDFHRSHCLATSGSWFLMLDHRTDFYLLNLFTRERIRLPTLEAMDGRQMKFERVGESDFLKTFTYHGGYGSYSSGESTKVIIENAVLWVDERSRDYLVVWSLECFFAYHKKGDNNNSWKVFQLKKNQGCSDMVFRESKLYVLSPSLNITVFDFSCCDSPNECASFTTPDGLTLFPLSCFGHLVITLSGEVLMIKPGRFGIPFFDVYKMDAKSSKWREIYYLGNEALLLDLGTTIAAKDCFGENSLYVSNHKPHRYNGSSLCNKNSNYVYDFLRRLVVQRFQHLADLSPVPFKDSRWFFPTFCGKSLL